MVKKAKRLDSRITSLEGQPVKQDRTEPSIDEMAEAIKERRYARMRRELLVDSND